MCGLQDKTVVYSDGPALLANASKISKLMTAAMMACF
jgi:hypothetical protein